MLFVSCENLLTVLFPVWILEENLSAGSRLFEVPLIEPKCVSDNFGV